MDSLIQLTSTKIEFHIRIKSGPQSFHVNAVDLVVRLKKV